MLNKRLLQTVPDAMPHVLKNVALQTVGLLANITLMFGISCMLAHFIGQTLAAAHLPLYGAVFAGCIAVRVACTYLASQESYRAAKSVKRVLRQTIYQKVVRVGGHYQHKISTAELLQLSVEGVEQLETYFGSYLPQFFYAMLSPIILFCVISRIHLQTALALLLCVPLIPISIIAIQKIAKKLLHRYWGEYAGLADHFLENLQGLNTLKIYGTDGAKHQQMNEQAQRFRVVTMKVLSMQLNSIIIMDLVAYGGAALGIVLACSAFAAGEISLLGCFAILLLCADFFLPLRMLGSFFHIAMNGISASKKIFALLDLPTPPERTATIPAATGAEMGAPAAALHTDTIATAKKQPATETASGITLRDLRFSYADDNTNGTEILHGISLHIPQNSFVSIVGKSGCGKSTIAGILCGQNANYQGSVQINGVELSAASAQSLARSVTLIRANSYIFKGTVQENLRMAKPMATDAELWAALQAVNLADFLRGEQGLDTPLAEKGSNFSGGQCQRLALARALLHDTPIYIFDEATSNIDVESENDIMQTLRALTKTKTVLLISHRLANVAQSDAIYLLQGGNIAEHGTHSALLAAGGQYHTLWHTQAALEHGKAGAIS